MAIGIFYGHLVNSLCQFGLFFPVLGMFYQEKSGNPAGYPFMGVNYFKLQMR
jgi:hypothetical protein